MFFDDNRILIVHTGSVSSGTWPIVFLRSGESAFEQAYEFTPEAYFNAMKALNKPPADYETFHLYIEVTRFTKPDILQLSFRGGLKPVALDFSLTTREYLDTDRAVSPSRIRPRMAGQPLAGYGTGFFVHNDGWILTCYHVVSDADLIKVLLSTGETLPAVGVERDTEHDLALLRISGYAPAIVPFSVDESIALGDEIYTLGFPVPNLQGFNAKLASGIISSLTGLMDVPYVVQISAPIQPGNSGGAVISDRGCLIGVASSTVKPKDFLARSGTLPQNINYAIRTDPALRLLERRKVDPGITNFESKKLAIQNLTKATVLILVYRFPDKLREEVSS
jgi:S1-C subfamily serine protease